ncbi:MAG TPA: lysophospholipase [Polyangiaceae bacterium]|jgi:alpha-beta hydrolase superfamily lysophospholipase
MALTGLTAVSRLTPRVLREVEISAVPDGDDAYEAVTLEHGEGSVQVGRGVTLYAQWWRPCFGSRGAVTIVHGLKDHSARYGVFAERLVARGFAVHAFDLRGHGRSGGARAWVDAFGDYVDDLDAVISCVRMRERRSPLFVFGHGLGGAIAALWSIETRRRIDGLVLSAASLQASDQPAEARATRVLAALAPRARILQLDLRRASRDRGTVEDALRDALVHQAPAPARTAKELLDAMELIDLRADELTAPLLALHGSADVLNPSAGSKRLVARASSEDKQVYVYDGLAHDLLHEPERARVVRDVAEWLVDRAPG